MSAQDDLSQLISRVAMSDRAAFSELFDRTSAKLFGVSVRILGDDQDAEDAMQDTYVKIWHAADRYRAGTYSPMTWLITIARNTAVDRIRARRRSEGDLDDAMEIVDPAPGAELHAMAAEERDRIRACLARLEPDKAEAVRRAYLLGDTYKDLAARFDVPLNTVRTWLRRSLIKLRECLAQ